MNLLPFGLFILLGEKGLQSVKEGSQHTPVFLTTFGWAYMKTSRISPNYTKTYFGTYLLKLEAVLSRDID